VLAIGYYRNVLAHACVGGKSMGEDIRKLEHGVHVVSGTPGRVLDMIKRRTLRTRAIKLLVLVSALHHLLRLQILLSFLLLSAKQVLSIHLPIFLPGRS